jgi:hypothetical protein
MRNFFYALIALLFINAVAKAQIPGQQTRRFIRFNFITRDSVNLALNEDFDIIEDSCATITRYGHLNLQKRIFTGRFKDVLISSPDIMITEGNFNEDGLKDGAFTINFLNGKLQAKGNFKNGAYDGPWQVFYDDGKPRINFNVEAGIVTITDAWDAKGKKIIDNGKGNYRAEAGSMYWRGKLLNGRPDGTWHAIRNDDATETDLETENYKNGVFQKGTGPLGEYKDAPRMILVAGDMMPFVRAEKLRFSSVPCNGVKRKYVVGAQYRYGWSSFSDEIANLVSPYISKFDIKEFDNQINIDGYVSTIGSLTGLQSSGTFREDIAHGLILQLIRLPSLVPATADGKPVKQKITFKFVFSKGVYNYSYRLLPVE